MDGIDRLYGLPFPYITGNAGCTGCYEVWVVPMIVDLILYLGVVSLLFKMLSAAKVKLKTNWFFSILGLIISIIFVLCFLCFDDHYYQLFNDYPYKIISEKLIW